MKYDDKNMEKYWKTLPQNIKNKVENTGIDICSIGMLQKLGDYYKNGDGIVPEENENNE